MPLKFVPAIVSLIQLKETENGKLRQRITELEKEIVTKEADMQDAKKSRRMFEG